MQWFNMTSSTYKSPVFIGLLAVMSVAVVLLLHHCVLVTCWNRRQRHHLSSAANHHPEQQQSVSLDLDLLSSSSRAALMAKAAVVCRKYVAGEEWAGEPTCPVCLAEFADGEEVRVLPECSHYFHGDCIDTWLAAADNPSCPLCRAETTPTPTPTPTPSPAGSSSLRGQLSLSVSLEDILVRT